MEDANLNTFKEMLKIEESMDATYDSMVKEIKDEKTRKIIQAIRDDERKHERNVEKIIEIISSD